jgi:hypothetical protein
MALTAAVMTPTHRMDYYNGRKVVDVYLIQKLQTQLTEQQRNLDHYRVYQRSSKISVYFHRPRQSAFGRIVHV